MAFLSRYLACILWTTISSVSAMGYGHGLCSSHSRIQTSWLHKSKSLWIDDHTQLLTMAHMGKPSIFIVISAYRGLSASKNSISLHPNMLNLHNHNALP